MPRSVLEAIQAGVWDYEPEVSQASAHDATQALPGTPEKLQVMALRLRLGLPLWHPADRRTYDGIDPGKD